MALPTYQEYYAPLGNAAGSQGTLTHPQGSAAPSGYGPAQVRAAYGINNILFGGVSGDGTGQTIAIVDAYDDPRLVSSTNPGYAASDLAQFDARFGLPDPPRFLKINQNGGTSTMPTTDPTGPGSLNWEGEEALDVEWAHALAPGANILLVESNSPSFNDLLTGVSTAAQFPGVSAVSMSWCGGEWPGDTPFDSYFTTPAGHQGVTFLAATGDSGSPSGYPAYSPNVVAVGGTTLNLGANNSYRSEMAWSGSGGGTSTSETEPANQKGVQGTGWRTVPDVSFDANPYTGVAIYDSYNAVGGSGPWVQIGGTSVACPCWAGLIAIVNQGRVAGGGTTLDGPSQTLPALYSLPAGDFHDITSGSNGGFQAGAGYDEVTGLGTPRADVLVPDLAFGVATQLSVTTQPPAQVAAGAGFGLTIEVEDNFGLVDANFSGNVTIGLANNTGGALGGTLTVKAVNGQVTFTGLTLTRAGSYTLRVSATGLPGTTTSAFTVTAAAATQLVVTTQPLANVNVGAGLALQVLAEDPYGNVDPNYNGTVTLALAANPGGSTLGGVVAVKAVNGVAVFAGLILNQPGSGYTLRATGTNLAAATTSAFNVAAAGLATQLVVTIEPPGNVALGDGFVLVVSAEDSLGQVESTFDGNVTLVLASGPAGALGGTLTVTAVNGVAVFSGLTLNLPADEYTLTATSAGLVSATTSAFAAGTSNQRFVAQLYRDLLGHEPDPVGLASWTNLLDQGTARSQVAVDIERSPEYCDEQVKGLYQDLLDRPADSGGLAGWVQFLMEGGTLAQVKAQILGSNEYFQVHGGGTSAGFVAALYDDILGRAPDTAGESGWLLLLAGGTSRTSLATLFLNSQEADVLQVEANYSLYLHRSADANGLAAFTSALAQGVPEDMVVAEIFGSNEYMSHV